MPHRITRRQAAILGAYTAHTLGPFNDTIEYVHTLKGFEKVDAASIGSFKQPIKEAAKADALAICATLEQNEFEPTQEDVLAIDQARVERFDKLINALHERFPEATPHVEGQFVETRYLESMDAYIYTVAKHVKLLQSLQERFPAVTDKLLQDGSLLQETAYLEAIDSLLQPEVIVSDYHVTDYVKSEEDVTALMKAVREDTEGLFLQAIDSLRRAAEQNDPHRNRVRKVLNSVVEAYEKLKQSKQTQEWLGAESPIPVKSVAEGLAVYAERKDDKHE